MVAPAYAGHGTIEETDIAVIVEYTGDRAAKIPDDVAVSAKADADAQKAQLDHERVKAKQARDEARRQLAEIRALKDKRAASRPVGVSDNLE